MRTRARPRRWSMMCPGKVVALRKGRWGVEKIDKAEKTNKRPDGSKREKEFTAQEKSRAVLCLWTEKRKPSDLCRDLGVSWTQLNNWQERAMEGILLALQPRADSVEKTMVLNHRLAVLLERKSKGMAMKGLEQRLARLQGSPAKTGDSGETGEEKKA